MNFKKSFFILFLASSFMFFSCDNSGSENKTEEATETEAVEENNAPPQSDMNIEQPAPTDVTDEELVQFAEVAQKLQVFNQSIQEEMIASVEEIGLDVNRFSEIQQSQQNPDANVDATSEELEMYQQAIQVLDAKQMEAQSAMQKMIEDNGMTEQRYQEIGMAIQGDPDMMAKFQELSGGQQ